MGYFSLIIGIFLFVGSLAATRDRAPKFSSSPSKKPPIPSQSPLPPDFDAKNFPGKAKPKEKRVLTPKEQQQLRKTQLAWRYEVLFVANCFELLKYTGIQ